MKTKALLMLLILALCASGCSKETENKLPTGADGMPLQTTPPTVNVGEYDGEMFSNRDKTGEYAQDQAVTVTLNGDTAMASSEAVEIRDGAIRLTEPGTYVISGTLNDGYIQVSAGENDKIQIVLQGASITSAQFAPIYVSSGDKVFLTLAEGTENVLENGGEIKPIDDNNVDGVIFSKSDLTINGAGSLTVTAPASHGIVCKDDLAITGGILTVEAAKVGIQANDSVRFTGATATVTAQKDGIQVENEENTEKGFFYLSGGKLTVNAGGDGVSTSATLQILAGEVNVTAGGGSANGRDHFSNSGGSPGGFGGGREPAGGRPGGERPSGGALEMPGGAPQMPGNTGNTTEEESTSMKGLKAQGNLQISGGTLTIQAADDGVHSNSSITVTGGITQIATGDDGFHADDTLTVKNGRITITESYEGLEAETLLLQGGEITLTADDDGLNASGGQDESGFGGWDGGRRPGGMSAGNGSILISGGTLRITASGDAIDSNGSLEITGGWISTSSPTQGDTSVLDYDSQASISGGTYIGIGGASMMQRFTDAKQGVLYASPKEQAAGTSITLRDAEGNALMTLTPELPFNYVIISLPGMVRGQTYTLELGNQSYSLEAS